MWSDLNCFFKSISIMQKKKKRKKNCVPVCFDYFVAQAYSGLFWFQVLKHFLQEFLLDFYQPAGLCRETAITEKITKFRHI